jgi:hypothetical protein
LGRGGFASRMLRVRHERRTSLTASLGCWHAQRCAVWGLHGGECG